MRKTAMKYLKYIFAKEKQRLIVKFFGSNQ